MPNSDGTCRARSRNSIAHITRSLNTVARIFFQAAADNTGQIVGQIVRASVTDGGRPEGWMRNNSAEEVPSNGRRPVAISWRTRQGKYRCGGRGVHPESCSGDI